MPSLEYQDDNRSQETKSRRPRLARGELTSAPRLTASVVQIPSPTRCRHLERGGRSDCRGVSRIRGIAPREGPIVGVVGATKGWLESLLGEKRSRRRKTASANRRTLSTKVLTSLRRRERRLRLFRRLFLCSRPTRRTLWLLLRDHGLLIDLWVRGTEVTKQGYFSSKDNNSETRARQTVGCCTILRLRTHRGCSILRRRGRIARRRRRRRLREDFLPRLLRLE